MYVTGIAGGKSIAEVSLGCKIHNTQATKNLIARERAETKVLKTITMQMPTEDMLVGKRVAVTDGYQSDAFDQVCARLGWSVTHELGHARVFIVPDPAALADDVQVAAVLAGGWVMTPATIVENRGVCIKYHDATAVRRKVYVTDTFRAERQAIARVLDARLEERTSWKTIGSLAAFATAKGQAVGGNASASVVALYGEGEAHIFENVPHCFNLAGFLQFITKIDSESTVHFGVSRR
jgi:hypothetical protein